MITNFNQLPGALNKFVADSQKKMRLATYNTLGGLAKKARLQIIAEYPKRFPDENGIRKNKGVPKQIYYDNKVDKSIPNNPSIGIHASDKISFMAKQEFGGTLTSGTQGGSAAVPFSHSLRKMRQGTRGMKAKYSVSEIVSSAKQAIQPSLKHGTIRRGNRPPQPFFMTTKSGHTMVAIRDGKKRLPIMELYHFDKKRKFRPRFGFFETVEGVVASSVNEMWHNELKKVLDRK